MSEYLLQLQEQLRLAGEIRRLEGELSDLIASKQQQQQQQEPQQHTLYEGALAPEWAASWRQAESAEAQAELRADLERRLAALRRQEELLTEKLPAPPAELSGMITTPHLVVWESLIAHVWSWGWTCGWFWWVELHSKLQQVVRSQHVPVVQIEALRMALYRPDETVHRMLRDMQIV